MLNELTVSVRDFIFAIALAIGWNVVDAVQSYVALLRVVRRRRLKERRFWLDETGRVAVAPFETRPPGDWARERITYPGRRVALHPMGWVQVYARADEEAANIVVQSTLFSPPHSPTLRLRGDR